MFVWMGVNNNGPTKLGRLWLFKLAQVQLEGW
jgi:hypothetical protein